MKSKVLNNPDLEFRLLEGRKKDIEIRTPVDNVIYYGTPITITGAVLGFVGGLVTYFFTKDPMSMAYGTAIGTGVCMVGGIISSEYLSDREYSKIIEAQNKLTKSLQ